MVSLFVVALAAKRAELRGHFVRNLRGSVPARIDVIRNRLNTIRAYVKAVIYFQELTFQAKRERRTCVATWTLWEARKRL